VQLTIVSRRLCPVQIRISACIVSRQLLPRCSRTVPYVKEMVVGCKARLTLLHVVETPLYWYGTMPPAFTWDSLEEIYGTGRQNLTNFACEHFSDLAKATGVETVCDRGDPGYAILAQAEKNGVDLIMMPTRGDGPFRSFLVGSANTRVLHRAECPVWTGAHVENESAPSHVRPGHIVCALDLEREASRVIRSAVALARTFSAKVCLVHCVPVPESGPTEDFLSEFDRFLADTAREKLKRIQEQAGTDFEVYLEGGSVSKVVRDAAIRQGADLVVIGRGHAQAPLSRLRTNAYAIVRDASCPVLSV
jgi:nucleotide-binding universal stress UspA family protein